MRTIACLLVSLLAPAVALAAVGNGIDVQWQDCVGGAQAIHDRTFNCNADQTSTLVVNFKVSQDLPGFIAFTGYIDLQDETPGPLAPFWHYESGGCQRLGGASPNGITISDQRPATPHCADNFTDMVNGERVSGVVYGPDYPLPGRGKFIVSIALGSANPIAAGDNMFAMSLIFNTRNRMGGGGAECSGCGQKVRLTASATLESNNGTPPVDLSVADKGQICATIQGASTGFCGMPVPVVSRTWGALKAMYR